jgi:hypothetical protein
MVGRSPYSIGDAGYSTEQYSGTPWLKEEEEEPAVILPETENDWDQLGVPTQCRRTAGRRQRRQQC